MKRRFRKLIALLAIATSISSMAAPLTAEAATWKQDSTGWWYSYDNGTYAKNGWKCIDNTWYYFDKSGYMKTGWVQDGNTWYYMDASGAMKTGWVEDGGKKYHMDENGAMQTGWFELNSDNKLITRTDTGNGKVAENIADTKKKIVYLGEDGAMATGWQDITTQYGTEKFYFDADGVMAIGTKQIDGQWYYFHKYEEPVHYTYVYGNKTGGFSRGAMQTQGVTTVSTLQGFGENASRLNQIYGWEIVDGTTIHYSPKKYKGNGSELSNVPSVTLNEDDYQFQRALAANKDKLFEYDYNISSGGKSQYTKGLYYVCSNVRRSDGVVISTVDNVQYGTLNGYRNAEVEAKFENYYREKFNIPDDYSLNLSTTLGQMWGYKNVGEDGDLGDMLVYFAESDRVSAYASNGVRYKYSLDENGNVVCEER